MRRTILIICMVLSAVLMASAEVKYVVNNETKDISKTPTERTIKKDTIPAYDTGWTYNGQKVLISKGGEGSAYVEKVSKKTGKPYKQYLGKELTEKYKKLCGLPTN